MWTVDSAVLLLAAGLLVKSSGACAGQVCVRMPGLTSAGIQSRSDPKVYVVQTATTAVERCMLASQILPRGLGPPAAPSSP